MSRLALVLWLGPCAATLAHGEEKGGSTMALALTSTSFTHQGEIPTKHTCEGADVSPELTWSGVPDGSKSLVLIVDDPDAPDPKAPRTRASPSLGSSRPGPRRRRQQRRSRPGCAGSWLDTSASGGAR